MSALTPEQKLAFERNLRLYRWYLLFSFSPFALPIIVLFWQRNGLDTFEIYLLQTIFSIAVVIMEVPTGMVADRLGKRVSLVLGSTICALSWVLYAASSGFWPFVAAEISIAVGLAFMSGADSAMLYDSLSRLGRAREFRSREGSARSLQMISVGACMLPGGFIGEYSHRLAIGLSAIGPFLAFLVTLRMTDAGHRVRHPTFSASLRSYRELMRAALKFVAKHRLVRWYILFGAVLIASNRWLLWLYQPYMEQTGFPVWGFGVAFALFNFFAAAASRVAHRALDRLGSGRMLALLTALDVLPMLGMALVHHPLGWLFVFGHQAIRGFSRPLFSNWILRYTFEDKRATVLSLASFAQHLVFAATAPLIGWIGVRATLSGTLLFQGALAALLLALLLGFYRRIPEKYFKPKAT